MLNIYRSDLTLKKHWSTILYSKIAQGEQSIYLIQRSDWPFFFLEQTHSQTDLLL